jgi:hypothetical protein
MNNVHFLFLLKFLNKMVNDERLNTSLYYGDSDHPISGQIDPGVS